MDLELKDVQGSIPVTRSIFGCNYNKSLIHQVVVAYMSSSRQGTRAQKSRGLVSGSGKKPWRQKGTGRARVGSIRSPLWRSGGVTFAASPQNHSKKINKKMYKGALKSIFSELIRLRRLLVFKSFYLEYPKTKFLLEKLRSTEKISNFLLSSTLIVIEKIENNLFMSSRNVQNISVCLVKDINPYDLIRFSKVIITVQALKKVEELLS